MFMVQFCVKEMVRAPFYDKSGVKKGAWSRDEDDKLRAYIQRYGHSNWRQLPKLAGLARCGKSCRLRWMNYLRPNLKHGNYTQEEVELIVKLRQQLGNKWSLIAQKLPGRTDNDIKNYWHSHIKKGSKHSDTEPEVICSKPIEYTESESQSVLVGGESESHHILESSLTWPMSTETSSTRENHSSFTSTSNDAQSSSIMKCSREENSVASWEILQVISSDFWSRPFLVESTSSYDIAPTFSYPYEGTDLSDLHGILDW